jgi:FAD binding domain
MDSLSLPTLDEAAGSGQPVADSKPQAGAPSDSIIIYLKPRLTDAERCDLDCKFERAAQSGTRFVAIVSSFRVDLGDAASRETEEYAIERSKVLGARVAVFRPGCVLNPASRLGAFYPLVPRRMCCCFLESRELFDAIESERRADGARQLRVFSLFGVNRPWRDVLAERRAKGLLSLCVTAVNYLLSWLLIGHVAAWMLDLLARWWPSLRRFNVGTLYPRSFRELLEIYNQYNHRHVKVVGYNNGVNHFGHQYPSKTVVSTVKCNRVVMAGADTVKADCGTTVRKALDFLAGAGKELPVVPNYSYVCLGTAFFVPIHGSAADFSTIAETITRAVLYDPVADRIISVSSDDPEFSACVYNLQADVLVLRLYLRVKPKARYFIRKEELANPTGAELLDALRDTRAANVEIRKASANAAAVTLCKYYHDPGDTQGPVLELPRDSLGRLWDRLEENPLTSFLMHASARHLAWHVELFFTAEEFEQFWQTHQSLPLRKIQVRYIRRDGLPHSPFREHDCVSVDLFMLRRYRHEFEAYLAANFAVVRSNPGKHSR